MTPIHVAKGSTLRLVLEEGTTVIIEAAEKTQLTADLNDGGSPNFAEAKFQCVVRGEHTEVSRAACADWDRSARPAWTSNRPPTGKENRDG